MKTIITPNHVAKYINNSITHNEYSNTVKLMNDLRSHAEGIYPKDEIEERRPSESEEIKSYRQKIWKPNTKETILRVINSLGKIRKSPDWQIRYSDEFKSGLIPENESLQKYCEETLPVYKSLTNRLFSVELKMYCVDANAVSIVVPENFIVLENEFVKPVIRTFYSDNVVEFADNDYCIIKSDEVSQYNVGSNTEYGSIFYVITTAYVQKWSQTSNKNDFKIDEYIHNLNYMPAFRLRGIFKSNNGLQTVFESRLGAMSSSLDEARREYSDMQAEVVKHIYSKQWVYGTRDCKKCSGTGKMISGTNKKTCDSCNGNGTLANSPYQDIVVSPDTITGNMPPVPPAGVIEKNVEIVKIQNQRIQDHKFNALSAINFQFLMQTPANESGVAKAYDKDETTNTVHAIAEDLVAILDQWYLIICDYRYSVIVPDADKRALMRPTIPVPERYDLIGSDYYLNELQAAKNAKIDSSLISIMEIEYAGKKFAHDTSVKEVMELVNKLDPFPGYNEEDKMMMLNNRGITQDDFIISSNIKQFVKLAMMKDAGFISKTYEQQMAVLTVFANEKSQKLNASVEIASAL